MIDIRPTRAAWVDRAIEDLPTILLDHAHCERKAAQTALKLMARYVDSGGDVPVPPRSAKPIEPPPTARSSRAFRNGAL
ncbi:MAG: tRNA isopentenyl-2-thiomethyl-A-37 hydroxylase MiaE [Polyangia bacterium]